VDEERKENHDEIKREGYPELGKRNEENVAIVSLFHHINHIDNLQLTSWIRKATTERAPSLQDELPCDGCRVGIHFWESTATLVLLDW
jgi:hypothetical protein